QVTGSALIYDQMFRTDKVVDVATVTKLTRNLFIIIIIPFVTSVNLFKGKDGEEARKDLPKCYTFIPLLVIGFLFCSLLRTIGDMTIIHTGKAFGLVNGTQWSNIYNSVSSFGTTYLLGIAMAGVGLSTNFAKFKGIGIKPFYIGFIAAVSVGIVSFILIAVFGSYVIV